ncbi:hypothetical protein BpHYR1_048975 [Brachionus plicatilis]|uniref:FLYWCH-type domain-containing protein n=1 Tax=Brachionus plicatilis TaxID=10195 RepID=A0A3M7RWE1_BRAPC|nr:hypothetical protein BpHYR1_048975 [Brachionus plicatilis]
MDDEFRLLSLNEPSPIRLRNRIVPRKDLNVKKPSKNCCQSEACAKINSSEPFLVSKSLFEIKPSSIVDYSDTESTHSLKSGTSNDEETIFSKTKVPKLLKKLSLFLFQPKMKSQRWFMVTLNTIYWICAVTNPQCKARIHSDLSYKIVKLANEYHYHEDDQYDNKEDKIVKSRISAKLKERAKKTLEKPRAIIKDVLYDFPVTCSSAIPQIHNLKQQIDRKRQKVYDFGNETKEKRGKFDTTKH